MSKLRIGRFTLDLTQALPELTTQWGDAFAVDPHPDYPGGLYAFVQNHKIPMRLDVLNALENGRTGILQNVLSYDVLNSGTMQKLAFVMERPPAPPLVSDLSKPFASFREDHLRQNLIRPILDTLVSFQERALFHGGISPLAIYAKHNLADIMLRECVTLPTGFRQPALFEPIERAQSRLYGKGDSMAEDDIFALGVTVYLLALGQNPFAGLSDEDLIRARLEAGTATLMINHAKLPPTILEFVRGTCGDLPKQRWNFGELENWASGQRVQTRSTIQSVKASRSLAFGGKEYFRPRNLAAVLADHPDEVRKLVESKEIIRWVQRSLGDLALYEDIKNLIEKLPPNISDDILAAKLAMVLDPQGPLRYKGLNVMPSGLGGALAQAFMDNDTAQQQKIAEVIASDLISNWASLPNNGPSHAHLTKDAELARGYLHVAGLGFGLERVLYELQHGAPCYSDAFTRLYVLNLKQLLPALDELAADSRRPVEALDRHSAAFLAARIGKGQENLLKALNPNKEAALRCIAILNLLANVQNRYGPNSVPRLANWLADTLKPALDRFHSSVLKSGLQKNLAKLAAQGDLASLYRAIDSPEVVEGDLQGFRQAARQYLALQQQIQEVSILLENKNAVGTAVGQRLAAALSVILGLAAVAAAIAKAL